MFSARRLIIGLSIAQTLSLAFGMIVLHNIESASLRTNAIVDGVIEFSPILKMTTLVWMSGVFVAVNWLVVTRVLSPVDNHLQQKHEESLMAMNELVRTRDAIVFGLAKLAESRDPETGQHLERISLYSVRLATAMRQDPRFRDQVSSEFIRMIGISSVLHDIGKVGVPDSLLLKSGPLSEQERKRIQLHASIGSDCISQIERRLGNSDFLEMARAIAHSHHEWWNGGGYPVGVSHHEIPLAARIVSVADVYDALASRRAYKDSIPHERCVEEIRKNSGIQFDPEIIDVFLSIESQFKDIAQRFADVDDLDRMCHADAELVRSVVDESVHADSDNSPLDSGRAIRSGRHEFSQRAEG